MPTLSPDGRRIAFMSARTGTPEIWVSDRDGSKAVQLTSFGGPYVALPAWSPDGRFIAFVSAAAGQSEIYLVRPEGGEPIRITNHPASDTWPDWSHDGRRLYFTSDRGGGLQVWAAPIDADGRSGEAVQATGHGGGFPRESPDGQFLYYAKGLESPSLWRSPVGQHQEERVLESLGRPTNYSVTRDGVFFTPRAASPTDSTLAFLRFSTGRIETVASFSKPAYFGLDATADGRDLVVTLLDQANADLMLVENFR